MEYIDLFEQIDQDLSARVKDLQKKQEQLIEQQKNLVETKQKIHAFLSDAHEMKLLLEFQPDLVEVVRGELNKIFATDSSENQKGLNKDKNKVIKQEKNEPKSEILADEKKIKKEKSEEQEKIEIFNYVDMQGKSTLV